MKNQMLKILSFMVSFLFFISSGANEELHPAQKQIKRIEISGPQSVKEQSAAYYTCWAYYEDGSWEDVTHLATWEEDSWNAIFENYGKLLTLSVTSNEWCRISVSHGGLSASFYVIIENTEIQLKRICINGPLEVEEESSAYYTCTAHYDDGRSEDITYSATWREDSWSATISNSGRLETSSVEEDEWCQITATYREVSDSITIKIKNRKD